jgi:hypothetical protein
MASLQLSTEISRYELFDVLKGMAPGERAKMTHDVYAEFFPPGEPDTEARIRCYDFATGAGCTVDNDEGLGEIWFVKTLAEEALA